MAEICPGLDPHRREYLEEFLMKGKLPPTHDSEEIRWIPFEDALILMWAPDGLEVKDLLIRFFERGVLIYVDEPNDRMFVKYDEVLAAVRRGHEEFLEIAMRDLKEQMEGADAHPMQ